MRTAEKHDELHQRGDLATPPRQVGQVGQRVDVGGAAQNDHYLWPHTRGAIARTEAYYRHTGLACAASARRTMQMAIRLMLKSCSNVDTARPKYANTPVSFACRHRTGDVGRTTS